MACFGLLNISRLFKQLCQYQAHAVNHQPRKCRTPDFYNRQNGTSWESGTFPIKFFPFNLYEYVLNRKLHVWEKPSTNKKKNQTKNEKHVFRRSFLKDGQTKNSCHSQHDAFFLLSAFRTWICFALCIFS